MAAGQGKNGQGARGHEVLLRDALMVFGVMHRRHQRGLAVSPALPPHACPLRHAGRAPVAADQNAAAQGATRGQCDGDALCTNLLRYNGFT